MAILHTQINTRSPEFAANQAAMLAQVDELRALLARIHDPEYVRAVRRALPDRRYGLGTMDDPVWPSMHEASATIAGGSVAAASCSRPARASRSVTSSARRSRPA